MQQATMLWAASLLTLGFVACGGTPDSSPDDPTSKTSALSTSCATPANGSVQGVDVSHYQGNYDWNAAHAGGIEFGYAQIGDGLGFTDPMFGANWANMQAAGVLRGAYLFFEPGQDAAAQANKMVAAVGMLGAGDLPCMLDVETAGPNMAAGIQTWINIVKAGTGLTPIIYTGPYFWEANVGSTSFGGNPLWIADYGPACPLIPNGWSGWSIWQYSDGGGTIDHDVFNGTLSQLQALGGGSGVGNCSAQETANAGTFGCDCADHKASGGYSCGGSGCSAQESNNAAAFGCSCVDHQGNGGYCDGTGCGVQETKDAAEFGCACVDHQANGGYCDGTGCTIKETNDAAKFGCACVDHQANGGYCDGTGCTIKETNDAAKFGCACVDHKADGGYCDGSGCTVKETNDAAKFGCQCVDHKGDGGYCAGSGCTVKETNDAAKFGCGCVDHKPSGGFCEGSGCTAGEEKACTGKGQSCSLHVCK